MAILKKIINVETNTKFIKVHKNGFVEIPDVVYHVLTEDGKYSVVGSVLNDDYPVLSTLVSEGDSRLLGFLEASCLDDYLANARDGSGVEEATKEVVHFAREAIRILPYLRYGNDVRTWIKKHRPKQGTGHALAG